MAANNTPIYLDIVAMQILISTSIVQRRTTENVTTVRQPQLPNYY